MASSDLSENMLSEQQMVTADNSLVHFDEQNQNRIGEGASDETEGPVPVPARIRQSILYDPEVYEVNETELQAEVAQELLKKKDNSMSVIFSIWSTMMGSTVLVMPKLFRQASLIPAIFATIIIGGLACYTAVIMTKLGKIYGSSTKDILDKGTPKYIRYATLLMSELVFVGASVLFHLYIVDSFMDFIHKDMAKDTVPRILVSIGTAVVVFIVGLLKSLKPLFNACSYCVLIVFFCLIFIIVKSIKQFGSPCEVTLDGDFGIGWQGIGPVASLMSVMSVSFFCHNFLLNMLNESTRPMKNVRNVTIAFSCTATSFIIPSSLAVLAFQHCGDFKGDFIEMFHGIYSDMARAAIILLVSVVYPILLFAARQGFMEEIYGENAPYPFKWHLLYNFIYLMLTTFPSVVNAQLAVVSAIVGLMGTYWNLILPPGVYLKARILEARTMRESSSGSSHEKSSKGGEVELSADGHPVHHHHGFTAASEPPITTLSIVGHGLIMILALFLMVATVLEVTGIIHHPKMPISEIGNWTAAP